MLRNSLILYAAKMVGYALRLIVPFFLVRAVSVADFGSYRQFFLIEVTILALFQFGVNQSLYYFIPRDEKNAGAFYINSLIFNLVIYTAAFGLIRVYSAQLSSVLNMPLLVDHFWELSVFCLFFVLYAASDIYLTARQRIKAVSILQIVRQLNMSVVTLTVGLATGDMATVFRAMAVTAFANYLMITVFIQVKLHGFRAERYFFDVMGQIRYGLVLGVGGTLWVLQSRLHELFVSSYFGQESFAVYSAGCTQIPIIDFFVVSVTAVTVGQIARLEKDGKWSEIVVTMRRIMTSLYALVLPGVAVLLLVSKPLILFMFTDAYADAVDVFRINTLVKICFIWNAQLVLRGMNRNDVVLYVMLAATALTPFALYAGMEVGGMVGVITAQCVMMIAGRLGIQFVFNRIAPVRLPYVVTAGEVLAMYRDNFRKGFDFLKMRVSPRS